MASQIGNAIRDLIVSNPHLSNEDIAAEIQRTIPGASTSAASVSSTRSRLKKEGALPNGGAAPLASSGGFAGTQWVPPAEDIPEETEEERSSRIRLRYRVLERMAHRVAEGVIPALIVSGPPGLGKSFTVEQVLNEREADFESLSGTISGVGLFISLWNMREGGVVVLDDCDDALRDETCLNLLKAVLDSSEVRRVSWKKRAHWLDEEGIDATFEFKGSVVFCTNLDFEGMIAKGSNMSEHLRALIDRSLYLSLTMRTREDFLCRLRQVAVEDGMLVRDGLTEEQAQEAYDFVVDNSGRFYSLSLRLMKQIGICMLGDPDSWRDDIEATKMRTSL